jgi:hypothetical protein
VPNRQWQTDVAVKTMCSLPEVLVNGSYVLDNLKEAWGYDFQSYY